MSTQGVRYHPHSTIQAIDEVYDEMFVISIQEPSSDYKHYEDTFFVASKWTLLQLFAAIKLRFNPAE